jgi:hypothetical protein
MEDFTYRNIVDMALRKRLAQIYGNRRLKKKRRRVNRDIINYDNTSWGRLLRDPTVGMSGSAAGKTFRYDAA